MSANEKPTLDVDQLSIIRGLLERQETKVDNMSSKVDLLDTRFRRIETTTETTRVEVERLNARVTLVETDIRGLKEKDTQIVRTHSDHELEQQAALGGAIAHVAKLESAVQAQGEQLAGLVNSQSAQTATLGNLNALLTTLTAAVTKNPLYLKVGMAVGAAVGTAVGAAIVAVWRAMH